MFLSFSLCMMENTWQICYSADVCHLSAAAWCCRFIFYLCIFQHVWRCLCVCVCVRVVFERGLIWCFQGDLNIYCCWGFCLSSLLFFSLSITSPSFHHFFCLDNLSSADVPWLVFLHPLLYSWNFFTFQVYLSSVLYPSKHHSHTSFLSPCVVSIYLVFLSLFIAPGLINCMGDLSLIHAFITLLWESYLNCALVKCVLRIETTETYQCR